MSRAYFRSYHLGCHQVQPTQEFPWAIQGKNAEEGPTLEGVCKYENNPWDIHGKTYWSHQFRFRIQQTAENCQQGVPQEL